MKTKLFLKALAICSMIFCQNSFAKTIILNINNNNSDGNLYEKTENVEIGDRIRFTNNLPYALNQQNASLNNYGAATGYGAVMLPNIPSGQFFEVVLNSASKTEFTFVHDNMNTFKFYNSRIKLVFGGFLGVNETSGQEKEKTRAYPNPCTDILNISSTENMDGLELYDVSGKLLFTKKINGSKDKESLDMTPYMKGKYFIRIKKSYSTDSVVNIIKK